MVDPASASEAERLRALASYELLDTPPEPEFDQLTALAADVFQVPIAMVSLVDHDRVWHKSMCGFGLVETPRAGAFCARTILARQPLVVPDATLDERFADSLLVAGESRVRFYAGAPLTTRAGLNIGAFCVMDKVPRAFGQTEVTRLSRLTAVVMAAIEARLSERRLRHEMTLNTQTSQALRDVEARHRRIADNTPGMVYQLVRRADGSADFTVVSKGCREIQELDPEALLRDADEYFKLIHPEDEPARQRMIAEALGTMKPVRWEGRHLLASGQTRWLQMSTQPERAATGDVFWNGVILDVTERKRTEERLRMLESSVDNATDAIVITEALPLDEPGPRITYVNRAFMAMSGYAEAEVLGRSPRMFQGPRSDPATRQFVRAALERFEPVQVELLNYRKDGGEFWVELNIVPVCDGLGRWTHWVSIQRDTTERRAAQQVLEAARDEAQRANLAKSEFLSRMSHELRTPLNAILGFGELLDLQAQTDRQRENVAHILKGGQHLLNLINEVLDIARIESGKIELTLESIPVAKVFNEAAALIQPLAARRNVHVGRCAGQACDGAVQADRQRLNQVVLNLLSNAVKYNRPGGTVGVSCEPAARAGWLRLSVSDTGPGIAPADLGKLFTPFERLGAERSNAEGTGIGLALSKRLVEAMGGTIGVDSAVGRGSTFYVELPASVASSSAAGPAGEPAADGADAARPTVLYIEDNPSNYALVEQVLELERPAIRLLGAMLGQLGLDMAREHRPDLILLDLQLPDISGDEVLRQLQADPRTHDIPIVMVSADATVEQPRRLLELGARAYLTKPLKITALVQTVDETIGWISQRLSPKD